MSFNILRDCKIVPTAESFDSCGLHISQRNYFIITANTNGLIQVYNMKNNTRAALLNNFKQAIINMQINGTNLYSASWDNTIGITDLQTGIMVRQIATEHTEQITGMQLYAHYVITCANDGKIRMFNPALKHKPCVAVLDVHNKGGVNAIHCSSDAPYIVSAGDDGRVVVTHVHERYVVASFRVVKQALYSVQRFFDTIYTGSASLGAFKYNIKTYCKEQEYKQLPSPVFAMVYKNKQLIAGMQHNIMIFDAESGKLEKKIALSVGYSSSTSRVTGIDAHDDMIVCTDSQIMYVIVKNKLVLQRHGSFMSCLIVPIVESKQVERMLQILVTAYKQHTYSDAQFYFK